MLYLISQIYLFSILILIKKFPVTSNEWKEFNLRMSNFKSLKTNLT